MASDASFDEWAILELMGHRKMAGRVSEVQLFGAKMLRIDIPSDPPATQIYGGAAIYCLTPTTEETCRAFAKRAAPAPVQRWELPALPERAGAPERADETDDDDFKPNDETDEDNFDHTEGW